MNVTSQISVLVKDFKKSEKESKKWFFLSFLFMAIQVANIIFYRTFFSNYEFTVISSIVLVCLCCLSASFFVRYAYRLKTSAKTIIKILEKDNQ